MDRHAINIYVALSLFAFWTAATWYLEGRIETLLRPDAILDRITYAIVGNLLIGVVGAVCIIRWQQRTGNVGLAEAGFGSGRRTIIAIAAGIVFCFVFYVSQDAPSMNPVVVLNAYAQAFVVSAAEVLVCWVVVGTTIAASLRHRGWLVAYVVAAIVASVLFGVYHYAHSAPFNTIGMVSLLTVIGMATSVFFFVSRDVYATIIFHNFLGTYGVTQALKASSNLDNMVSLQAPLLGTAIIATLVLFAADRFWLRRAQMEPRTAHTRS